MRTINDGGQAFPVQVTVSPMGIPFPGNLRDWFAGQALMGELTAASIDGNHFKLWCVAADTEGVSMAEHIAREAYDMADAMLAEREKEQQK